jgi:hypothetical protein
MEPSPAGRAWTAFSLIGIGLWIGITVLVGVLDDDPTDGRSTLIAFVSGGAAFFALMFGAALLQQLRWRAESDEGRFGKRLAIGYTLAGIVVTALGLGWIWASGVGDADPRLFYWPLIAIVVVWAGVALWALNHYRQL